MSSYGEGGENLGGLKEEAGVKMNLPCVGSKLREGSGLSTPEPSGRKMSQQIILDTWESRRQQILLFNKCPVNIANAIMTNIL